MKKYIDIAIAFICSILVILFLIYQSELKDFNQYNLLSIRNYSFIYIGFYFFFVLKSKSDFILSFPNHLCITQINRIELFILELKRALLQPIMIIILVTYCIFNLITLINSELKINFILFDFSLLLYQYIFFVCLMVFLKNFLKKEGVNIISIMIITIITLNIAGKTFDQNIYFLLNPFVGWLKIIDIISFDSFLLKILSLKLVIASCSIIMIKLTKKQIVWHV